MGVVSNWATTSRAAILSPGEFYSDLRPREGFGPPVGHVLVSSLLPGLLLGVIGFLLNIETPIEAVQSLLALSAIFGGMLFVSFVGDALAVHAFVFLLGGRDLSLTVDALSYPTAFYVVSWIPLVNLLVGLYVLYLQAKGLASLHDFSTEHGLVAAFFGAIFGWVVIVLALLALLVSAVGLFGLVDSL